MSEECSRRLLDEEETRQLLHRAQQGDFNARERLVEGNSRLIYSMARRFIYSGRDLEDLFQVGSIGLLKAIDRFDFNYDVCFSTYAVPLIMGEIRRFLRDDSPMTVSRSLKEKARLLESKRRDLQLETGRDPELWQLAEQCQMSLEEAVSALEALRPPLSINDLRWGKDNDHALESFLPGEPHERSMDSRLIDRMSLEQNLDKLPPRLAAVLRGRYFDDKPQRQLAEELGVSQVQISRLERQALVLMRQMYNEGDAV